MQRLDYKSAASAGYQAFGRLSHYVATSGLQPALLHMVYLRVSQINGCAYCVDLHFRDAVREGVEPRKLNGLVTWRESPFFDARERAALRWAEVLTTIADGGAPDPEYAAVSAHFEGKELADLTYAIALMNAFNRLGVGFAMRPDPAAS